MDVIKIGTVVNLETWKEQVTCESKDKYDKDGCGAVLLITAQDLIIMHWYDSNFNHRRYVAWHYYPAIKCLVCGKYNGVEVPDLIFQWLSRTGGKSIFDGFDDRLVRMPPIYTTSLKEG